MVKPQINEQTKVDVEEEVLIPNFDHLVGIGKKKIEEHFDQYGNSWVTLPVTYWNKRIDTEAEKIKSAKTDEERQKYLLNMLNICAMNHNNISVRKILQ